MDDSRRFGDSCAGVGYPLARAGSSMAEQLTLNQLVGSSSLPRLTTLPRTNGGLGTAPGGLFDSGLTPGLTPRQLAEDVRRRCRRSTSVATFRMTLCPPPPTSRAGFARCSERWSRQPSSSSRPALAPPPISRHDVSPSLNIGRGRRMASIVEERLPAWREGERLLQRLPASDPDCLTWPIRLPAPRRRSPVDGRPEQDGAKLNASDRTIESALVVIDRALDRIGQSPLAAEEP